MEFDEYSIKSSSDLRAEAGVLLTSDKITKSKHEMPLNATEQDADFGKCDAQTK